MKKDVLLSLFGLICLGIGFFSFLYGKIDMSIAFTLCGVAVYSYKQYKKEKD